MTDELEMVDYALKYAKRGWYVFPVREKPGNPYTDKNGNKAISLEKTPYVAKGLLAATLDVDQIREWWRTWPQAMIGINCGLSGLFVVDLDVKTVDGKTNFFNLGINTGGALNSITPSGGLHIIFTGQGKTTTNSKTGIDTRGEGGYFIVPPSEVVVGKFVGKYTPVDSWNRVPATIPQGLFTSLFPVEQRVISNAPISGNLSFSKATLFYMAKGAVAGERNSNLFKAAADFAGCGYTLEECESDLWPISERIGFDKASFSRTVGNAYSKPRNPSIPLSLQEKVDEPKKNYSKIDREEKNILENAVLSCMIQDNSLIPRVMDILIVSDISDKNNKTIFSAILNLYNEGNAVDRITLFSKGIPTETSDKLIEDYNITLDNALSYAAIIKEIASIYKFNEVMDKGSRLTSSGKSLSEAISLIEKEVSDISISSGIRTTVTLNSEQAMDSTIQMTKDIVSGKIVQMKTGFLDFDKESGGLYPWDLLLLTAVPGAGKSALALSIVKNVGIDQNLPILFFTLEMSVRETIARLVCQITGLKFNDVLRGKLDDVEWVKYQTADGIIRNSKIFFDDSSSLTVPELRAKVRKYKEEHNIVAVVIDQLQQMKGYLNQPVYIQYDNICYDLKTIGKDFVVPILLCHQLKTRTGQDKKAKNADPDMASLNQAGERAATLIWAIVHKRDEEKKIIASKIVVLKNRNGPTQDFPIAFVGNRMLFSNAARTDTNAAKFVTEKDYKTDDLPDCGTDD